MDKTTKSPLDTKKCCLQSQLKTHNSLKKQSKIMTIFDSAITARLLLNNHILIDYSFEFTFNSS